jgi:signal transduction histidine kinase
MAQLELFSSLPGDPIRTYCNDALLAFVHDVTVLDGLLGVARIAGQLRQRRCRVRTFTARATVSRATWVVEYVCVGTTAQVEAIRKFVDRIPCVVKVESRRLACCRMENGAMSDRSAAGRDVTDKLARQERAALRRVATLVAHGAPPTDVFKAVATEVALLLDSDLTLIGRYEANSAFTYLAAGGTQTPTTELNNRLALGGNNLVSKILRTGRSEAMSYVNASGPTAAFARKLKIRNAVGTPILVEDKIWGVMIAGWTQPRENSPETLHRNAEVTELVATAIADAVSRAALVESRARVVAAADGTRRRIERDLHDGAQQRLVTLLLKVRTQQSPLPPELAKLFDDLASELEEVLTDLRELARGIHPSLLSAGGLGPALKSLARRAPLPVDVIMRGIGRLPERIEVALYYIVAEALTNVAKHAQGSAAVVDVTADNGIVRVTVSDDGVGGADPSRGSGLLGLRDRVEALGGTMSLTSPPAGTTLAVEFPMTS